MGREKSRNVLGLVRSKVWAYMEWRRERRGRRGGGGEEGRGGGGEGGGRVSGRREKERGDGQENTNLELQ